MPTRLRHWLFASALALVTTSLSLSSAQAESGVPPDWGPADLGSMTPDSDMGPPAPRDMGPPPMSDMGPPDAGALLPPMTPAVTDDGCSVTGAVGADGRFGVSAWGVLACGVGVLAFARRRRSR